MFSDWTQRVRLGSAYMVHTQWFERVRVRAAVGFAKRKTQESAEKAGRGDIRKSGVKRVTGATIVGL